MSTLHKVGTLATMGLLVAVMAMPADAQSRKRSGSSGSSGARAVPRSASSGGGQPSAPRAGKESGQATSQRPSGAPREPQAPREGAHPRPADAPTTGQAVARPSSRPGGGGHYPVYGQGGRYSHSGFRPYPWYGFGYRYNPSFYWGVGGFYGPYYYSPWIYWSYWNSPAFYYNTFDGGYSYAGGGSSLKVNVEPKSAEVYVDGYLAGIVDQFDGMFQSLSIEPGEHEITIYQEGFRSMRQRLYLNQGSTMRIKGAMERLAPGEPNEPRPQAAQAGAESQAQPSQILPTEPYWLLDPQSPAPNRKAPETPTAPGDSRYGQLAIRVQPADAEVLIDGETWRAPAGAERLVVSLAPGTHRVEIRREGYDAFVTAVDVRRGETTPLNVSLARF